MQFTKLMLTLSLGVAAVSASTASAHDGWLELKSPDAASTALQEVSLQIGHENERRTVDLTPLPNWVRQAVIAVPDGTTGKAELRNASRDIGLSFTMGNFGSQVVALTTYAFTNQMAADPFNEYLRQEGLVAAIEDRTARGLLGMAGREIYHRAAKLIVGSEKPTGNEAATRPIGLTLEIVPQCDPASGGCGARLPVQVLFNDRPLAGARIVLNDLSSDQWPTAVLKTNADGLARFDVPSDGEWMVSTVWSWPIEGDERGDYETIFSSLAFNKQARLAGRNE